MIIWHALQRIFAKHFLYHMAIPWAFGAAAEMYLLTSAGATFAVAFC
jgi:hypothetical protein